MSDKSQNTDALSENTLIISLLKKTLATEEKLSDSIGDLSKTLSDVRVSIGSMQTEIKNHSEIISKISTSMDEARTSSQEINSIRQTVESHIVDGKNFRRDYDIKLGEIGCELFRVRRIHFHGFQILEIT